MPDGFLDLHFRAVDINVINTAEDFDIADFGPSARTEDPAQARLEISRVDHQHMGKSFFRFGIIS